MSDFVSNRISTAVFAVLVSLSVVILTSCSKPGLPFYNRIPRSADRALQNVDSLELLGLDPYLPAAEYAAETFQGWSVLRRQSIDDAATREKLIAAFKKGVAENDGTQALCFNPRHGLRVVSEGKVHDFVICFECFQVRYYGGRGLEMFLISDSPKSVFNDAFQEFDPPGGAQRECFAACTPLLKSRPAAWDECTDECWAKWKAARGVPSPAGPTAAEDSR